MTLKFIISGAYSFKALQTFLLNVLIKEVLKFGTYAVPNFNTSFTYVFKDCNYVVKVIANYFTKMYFIYCKIASSPPNWTTPFRSANATIFKNQTSLYFPYRLHEKQGLLHQVRIFTLEKSWM